MRLDELRYRICRGVPAPVPVPPAPAATGPWLAVVPAAAAGDRWVAELLDHLRGTGATVTAVEVPAGAGRDGLAAALRTAGAAVPAGAGTPAEDEVAAGTGAAVPAGVLSLLALDEAPDPGCPGLPAGLPGTLALIQALGDLELAAPLWLVTRQAVAVGGSDPLRRPGQAATWGIGRVVGLEQPRRWGGLVDLPDTLDAAVAGSLAAVLAAGGEDQVAIRAAGVFARRLVRARCAGEPAPRRWAPRADGTVLITGGGGVQAGRVARWLAGNGAGHLLLAARQGADTAGMAELVAELEALGARVTVAALRRRDREQLRAALALVPERFPLSAVVHTAGIGRLQPLTGTTPADLAEVVEAKLAGARLAGRADPRAGAGAGRLRAVLLGAGDLGQRRAGRVRRGERLPGRAREHRRGLGLPAHRGRLGRAGDAAVRDGEATRGGAACRRSLGQAPDPGRAADGRCGLGCG